MKVITVVCWIITAVALLGLAVWFVTGTVFGFMSDRWGGWNFGMNIGGFESLTGPFDVEGSRIIDESGVSSISIDWVAGEVRIIPHDENEIRVTEFAQRDLHNNEKFYVSTSGDTLVIKYTERNLRRRVPRKQLEVLVPRTLSENMDMLSINTVSEGVYVSEINASVLKCDTVSGSVNISGEFDNIKVNSVSGRVTIENTAQNSVLDAETVSGRMEISGAYDRVVVETVSGGVSVTSAVTPSSLKANSVSGSFDITVPEDASISVNHSSISGRLSSDIPIIMEGKGAQFVISTVSGSTKIHTNKNAA